jgi:hypothetical protein
MSMKVKGTALIARHQTVAAEFGEDAWEEFFNEFVEGAPELAVGVLPITSIPVDTFLAFSEALVKRFYKGDPKVHWRFGEDSANWALTDGPYSNFRGTRDAAGFLTVAPALWRAYYSAGSFEAGMEDSGTHTWAHIDSPTRHLHFEYSVMGFVKRALELVGAQVHGHEVVRGFSRGDADVYYRFELG